MFQLTYVRLSLTCCMISVTLQDLQLFLRLYPDLIRLHHPPFILYLLRSSNIFYLSYTQKFHCYQRPHSLTATRCHPLPPSTPSSNPSLPPPTRPPTQATASLPPTHLPTSPPTRYTPPSPRHEHTHNTPSSPSPLARDQCVSKVESPTSE